jgi:His-Xaa-Ser system protein HxsD
MPESPINIDPKKREATILVDTKLYPLEVIYSAAYVFLDKAHFLFGGDPKKEVIVSIKPKEKGLDLRRLCLDFSNELINYSVYVIQAAKKQAIREAIIRRALATNALPDEPETDDSEEEWLDDPEGIAKPWSPERAKGIKKPES